MKRVRVILETIVYDWQISDESDNPYGYDSLEEAASCSGLDGIIEGSYEYTTDIVISDLEEEFATDINAGSNDEYITLPKVAFDRMIARMESQGEKDWDGESWFINVKDAARIVFEIVREYQPEPEPQSNEPETPWGEAIMRTFLGRG